MKEFSTEPSALLAISFLPQYNRISPKNQGAKADMGDKLFSYFSELCEKNRLPEEKFRKAFPFLFEKDAPARIKTFFDLLLSEPKEILPSGLF